MATMTRALLAITVGSALAMLPAADLDGVVMLHVAGPWLLVIAGGPTVDRHDGALHAGWNAELGVAWQP